MSNHASFPDATTVQIERILPGPIDRVWAYLVDADKRATWLAGGPVATHVGGDVTLRFHNSTLTGHDDPPPARYANEDNGTLQGRVLACEPPHLLEFTWGIDADASRVRFDLSEDGDRVYLRVTHRQLPDRATIVSVSGGWHTHLDILVARLDNRAPLPFWPTHGRLEADYAARLDG